MCLKKVRKKYSSDYNGMLPRNIFIQKKSLKGNIIKNLLKICNFIEVTLRCGCSPVNLMHTFRSPLGDSFCLYCFMQVKVVRDDLQYERENAETSLFKICYGQACAVAALIDIQPTMPRVASRKIFRANAESNTPCQYYLRNVCYSLIDHLTKGIDNRFDK